MSVTTPCYCSRVDAQRAIDFKDSLVTTAQADRAIQSASRNIEGHLHRLFYPWDGTKWFDWPLRTTSTRIRGGCGWTGTTSCA
jgi:hypothetical protein